jgi:hypothetical protein
VREIVYLMRGPVASGGGRHADDAHRQDLFPLDDIAEGLQLMRANRHFGKIVIAT